MAATAPRADVTMAEADATSDAGGLSETTVQICPASVLASVDEKGISSDYDCDER
jgi:hypothetical protein